MSKQELLEKLEELKSLLRSLHVGHDEAIDALLTSLLCEGHILLQGYVGLGKTTLAKIFSMSIGGSFSRIQMTPDLLPSDLLGTVYFDFQRSEWRVKLGPLFANVVLIDELNRASPKTQAALLEAMQEKQITIEGKTYPLPRPFLVLATMIPIYGESSYEVPLGGIDRFAFSVFMENLTKQEELEVLDIADEIDKTNMKPILEPQEILNLIEIARQVTVSQSIKEYIVDLVSFIRTQEEVEWPPSPRASIWIMRGARARALLMGRNYVIPDDVKAVARIALRHRIVIKPEYTMDNVKPDDIIESALKNVPVPLS
ncbi:MAG: AAA domain-containing protein [Desulfurococcales archaeon]|jgi:MoxR-like ATPase|nr:AAA domain-containing protein [Desulfurococcales archaeon]